MNPHTSLVAELYLMVVKAEAKAEVLRARHTAGEAFEQGVLDDHRTEVLGELLDAIERSEPELGRRIQAAMYPTSPDEDEPPAQEEVNAEIAALLALKPRVRHFSKFQDDNHAAIDAQVQVLSRRMAQTELNAAFAANEHNFQAAQHAYDWLRVGGLAPSTDWQSLA